MIYRPLGLEKLAVVYIAVGRGREVAVSGDSTVLKLLSRGGKTEFQSSRYMTPVNMLLRRVRIIPRVNQKETPKSRKGHNFFTGDISLLYLTRLASTRPNLGLADDKSMD